MFKIKVIMKSTFLKTVLTLFIINFLFCITNAQISINEDGASPDASAILDVKSSDKGVLVPRMNSTARNNINNPANGLLVYDTTTNSFWYFTTAWVEISSDNLNTLEDADNDTKIQVEKNNDEDIIRFDLKGTEFMRLNNGRIEVLNTGNSIFLGDGAGGNDDYKVNTNIFIGDSTGYHNSSGSKNIAIGYEALYHANSIDNTAIGYQALYNNTTGEGNLAIGIGAGLYNQKGNEKCINRW